MIVGLCGTMWDGNRRESHGKKSSAPTAYAVLWDCGTESADTYTLYIRNILIYTIFAKR